MKILTCFQSEHAILRIRLFDPIRPSPEEYVNLDNFHRYRFSVTEANGYKNEVVILKDNECITTSTDNPNPLGLLNTLNIQLVPQDTEKLRPNPPNQDKIRQWTIIGEDEKGMWITLDRGYFYIDSMVAI